MLNRRSFLGEATTLSAALAGYRLDGLVDRRPPDRAQGASLRLLVLGGTQYVGPAIVEEALARGHQVTLFNRGLTNPHLFAPLERLRGNRFPDRGTGLSALRGREWDAVIDVSGFFPRQLRGTTELLRSSGRYVFISSIAVYRNFHDVGLNETSAVRTMPDPTDESTDNATYGARKALCEDIVRDVFADRHAVVRAHSIQGPHDPGDGIRYWATRMGQGGDVLAPGTGRDAVQFVDVRDVAWLAVQGAEGRLTGTCNAIGPREPLTMSSLLDACQAVAGRGARLHWASEEFLRAQGIRSWGNMPLWAPLSEEAGFMQIDGSRAREAGFVPRPVEETIRGVLAATRLPLDYEFGAKGGIPTMQEQEALSAWRRRG
jgi:2'-hydroxyisoflavone reductase